MTLFLHWVLTIATSLALAGISALLGAGPQASGVLGILGAIGAYWLGYRGLVLPLRALQDRVEAQQSQSRLVQSFMDNAPMVIAAKGKDGRYLSANAEFERTHGITSLALAGKLDTDFMAPETAEAVRANDLRVLETGETLRYQVPIQSSHGLRQMEAIKFPLVDAQRNIIGVGLMATDVTEREITSEKFARIFHASPNWIVITRLTDGVVIDANEGFETIGGHSRADAIGHPIGNLDIWVHAEQRAAIVETLLRDGRVIEGRAQIRRKDGEIRDFVANAVLIDLEGKTNSHAVWISRDVTDERLAERALRESEARFFSLFEMSPLPTSYSFDTDNYTTYYRNAAFYATFGYDKATTAALSTAELGLWVHPQDAVTARELREKSTSVDNWVVQVRHADGRHLWVSIYARVIQEPHRKMLVTTLFDITEQLRTQQKVEELNASLEERVNQRTEQLQAANAELSQAMRTIERARDSLVQSEKLASLGALVAGVAHELNTPIGNGLTVASALEERVRAFASAVKQPMQRSALDHFISETQMAADLLVRSLSRSATLVTSFKQIAVDQTSAQRRSFDLAGLVDEVVLTISPSTRRTHCEVRTSVAPGLRLDSFPGPLVQVLTNLIDNAVLHGFTSGHAGSIEILGLATNTGHVQITVQDNGRGIAPEHVKRIFDPFFTTRLGQGGSGLGLHIVHNIVTSVLGGQIEVHTAVGEGTRFVLLLPVTAPHGTATDPART